jgi:glycosyltransferase involved in cell wall biosynthesis
MPEISVVMPTWNRRALLLEAIASVRAQTFGDWELIVVDDGSTDDTDAAVAALDDARIRLLRRPHTGNVARCRNEGVANARGPWLAFLDSDDLWAERKLEVQLEATKAAGTRWSYTGYTLMDERRRTVAFASGTFHPISGRILRELLTGQANVTVCTVMLARDLFDEVGGFALNAGREDYDLVLRVAKREPVVAVGDVLVQVRSHAGRMTSGLDSPHQASLLPLQRLLEEEGDPSLRRLVRARIAELLLEGAVYEAGHGRNHIAARWLARSMAHRPSPARWLRAAGAVLARALQLR